MSGRSGSITVPEWQDDSEVTACPICKRQFYFLFRKHHCRRCGRVICNDCSPHRITLPRQYVVRPPHENAYRFPTEDDADQDDSNNPALGGGETVRVCNPCVPDPNYGPPPSQLSDQPATTPFDGSRAHLPPPIGEQTDGVPQTSPFQSPQRSPDRDYPDRYRTTGSSASPTRRTDNARFYYARRSASQAIPAHEILEARNQRRSSHVDLSNQQTRPPQPAPSSSRPVPGVVLAGSPAQYRRLHSSSPSAISRASSLPNATARPPVTRGPASHDVRSPETIPEIQRRRRPVVREEDECPVCGTQDPPFGSTGSSENREAHIETCINSRLRFSQPPPQPEAANTDTDTPPAPSSSHTPASNLVAALGSSPATGTQPRQRMLVYHATEKDCFDASGNAQECVICFDEFEVGDEMGRLECLCKFHRGCIRGWWESGKWGSCPTHALHE